MLYFSELLLPGYLRCLPSGLHMQSHCGEGVQERQWGGDRGEGRGEGRGGERGEEGRGEGRSRERRERRGEKRGEKTEERGEVGSTEGEQQRITLCLLTHYLGHTK